MKRTSLYIVLSMLLLSLTVGCNFRPQGVYRTPKVTPPRTETAALKVGLVPAPESLPLWVGLEKGFYEDQQVELTVVPYTTAAQRDGALARGEVDGIITDLVSAVLLVDAGTPAQIVSLIQGAKPDQGPVAVLSAPDASITELAQLQGQEVAVAAHTSMHYAAERMLGQRGADLNGIEFVDLVGDRARYDALLAGRVKAAVLPEPWATVAVARGAKELLHEAKGTESLSLSVLLLTEKVLAEQAAAVADLFIAYNRAVSLINLNPNAQQDLMLAKTDLVEGAVIVSLTPYPFARKPAPAEVEPVLQWVSQKGLVKGQLTYDQLVGDAVLPK